MNAEDRNTYIPESPNLTNLGVLSSEGAPSLVSAPWYIFRYRMITCYLKDCIQQIPHEVYFPIRKVRNLREATTKDFLDQPVIPGYIFVHATLQQALALSRELDLYLWRKRNPLAGADLSRIPSDDELQTSFERSYYAIPDTRMRRLMRAVELSKQDFKLLDPTSIDLSKDDLVEIIAGDYKGTRGYLKSVNGSSGGLVIVPLTEGEEELSPDTPSKAALLHYGIPAQASEIAILQFAQGSRRAIDQLAQARKTVDSVFEAYVKGEPIPGRQANRLLGYHHRFSQVQLERPIQRARLALLLHRIYTLLELPTEQQAVANRLREEIFPDCQQRIAKLKKGDKVQAQATFQSYQEQLQATETAPAQRQAALSQAKKKK